MPCWSLQAERACDWPAGHLIPYCSSFIYGNGNKEIETGGSDRIIGL